MIKCLSADSATAALKPFEYDPGEIKPTQIEIHVEHCGVCHSDLSMKKNDWGNTKYPFVPGHEVVGTISKVGSHVNTLKVGERVGLGWIAGSCMTCQNCVSGDLNLCPKAEQTIIARHGGFATHVRCNQEWALPLPDGINIKNAGPLFCGGITVFNPLVQFDVKPTDKVGVIGIGGLGHLALQFLKAWGCEVTAFTSNPAKTEEAKKLGAHKVVSTNNDNELRKIKGTLNFIISTANADLDWTKIISALSAKGRLHFVGVVPKPISTHVFQLISSQASISGSPLGSPSTSYKMLEFCARHNIEPVCEYFKMSQANEALAHLESGKARYRIILENDL